MTFDYLKNLFLGATAAIWLISSVGLADPSDYQIHDSWVPYSNMNKIDSSTDESPDLYHGYDVGSYDLSMEFDPVNGTLAGLNVIQFTATVDLLGTLILDAVDMDIQHVVWRDGSTLLTTYDQKQLKITLPYPMPKGSTATIAVKFSSQRPQNLRTASADPSRRDRLPSAYTYTQPDGSRRWFPCHDIPGDKTVTKMRFVVPAGFSVASNGDESAAERLNDGRLRYHFSTRANIATYLTSVVLSPLMNESIGSLRNIPLLISGPSYLMPALRRDTARTFQMMNVFEQFTQTPYAFQKYRQTVAEGYGGSMEHQSATSMGGFRIVGDSSGEPVVAHELAHQWFGDLVTCGIWGDMWLNEGFASYMPHVFYTAMGEHDRVVLNYVGSRDSYLGSTNATNARPLSTPEEWPNYNIFDQHSYAKGSMVIHLFRNIANSMAAPINGVEAFSRALGIYLHEHAYSNGRYYDLQHALEKATGRSWQRLFDQWVLQKGHPDVRVGWTWNESTREVSVDVTQLQAEATDPRQWGVFSFPLGIKTFNDQGQSRVQWHWVTEAKQTFKIPASTKITAITVDPTMIIPGQFAVTQPVEAFAYGFSAAVNAVERAVVLDTLLRTYPADKDLAPAFQKMVEQTIAPSSLALLAMRVRGRDGLVNEARMILEKSRGKVFTQNERIMIVALESWLIKMAKPEDRPTFVSLQTKWQAVRRVEERENYLEAMKLIDAKAAQAFALQELAKPKWTDRDRLALVKVITAETNEVTRPFIFEMLKTVRTSQIGQAFFQGLEAQKFHDPESLSLLKQGALTHRDTGSRAAYVRLIGFQDAQKDLACAAIKEIVEGQTQFGTPTDTKVVLPEAKKTAEKLGCPAEDL